MTEFEPDLAAKPAVEGARSGECRRELRKRSKSIRCASSGRQCRASAVTVSGALLRSFVGQRCKSLSGFRRIGYARCADAGCAQWPSHS